MKSAQTKGKRTRTRGAVKAQRGSPVGSGTRQRRGEWKQGVGKVQQGYGKTKRSERTSLQQRQDGRWNTEDRIIPRKKMK